MELRQLRYFVATAHELHFGRAAQSLGISQPSLTQQIQRLEKDLRVRLFDRDSHGVQLTAAGTAFLGKAEDVVRQARKAEAVARGVREQLRIGFSCPAGMRLLPHALRTLRSRHPDLRVSLRELWSGHQVGALLTGELDVGFLFGPVRDSRLACRTVLREPFVALLPAGHRLAESGRVPLSAFAAEPQVLFRPELNPTLHRQAHDLARDHGAELQVRHAVPDPSGTVPLVVAGHAVALTSAARAELSRQPGLVARRLADTDPTADVVMAWPTGEPSRPVQALLDAVGVLV